MVRIQLLLTALILSLFSLSSAVPAIAEAQDCPYQLAIAGLCPDVRENINNGGVDLSAGYETGGGQGSGSDAGGGESGASGSGSGSGNGNAGGGQVGAAPVVDPLAFVRDDFTVNCIPGSPCDPNLVVRVSDLVNFQPAAPSQTMEPRGWSVAGLPANFIASASEHSRTGALLGYPAEVRFTPVGYRWIYGDGTQASTNSGGATWAALGLPEFSDTATSHAFARPGSYAVVVAVVYSAEYRFAGLAWRPVQGTLSTSASPIGVIVGDAQTVLVNLECTTNPAGPGC
ncbi:hypothetical protein E3O62_12555 [Cryobacterium sp. TMT2-15-1]|uniref:hypothetical protein n=1 Tax=Cryobacterium sp. TMT2-15-1 TaxID=1259246 RepID=UPI00106AF68D|nr:hypothetical protein [Cryobacterium sp. TMT2-15-1]TFC56301.1 hypothetical protein E3O62_12555 [Cryobacterium sp. TMT2-15-1]